MKYFLYKIYCSSVFSNIEIFVYFITGRNPWSLGYLIFRNQNINKILNANLDKFSFFSNLPKNYGFGLDERIVEYPWIISHIPEKSRNILDAGSILNYDFVLSNPRLTKKNILISNLNPEGEFHNNLSVSYLYGYYGDLRNNVIKDGMFDVIVCGSVLEHVGMDNAYIYKNSKTYKENKPKDYLRAVKEFKRILKKNGVCLITIPFGRHANYGWLQIFDAKMIIELVEVFGKQNSEVNFYKYSQEGWQISNLNDCKNAKYFDVHRGRGFQKDKLAAAEAVACIKMIKNQ